MREARARRGNESSNACGLSSGLAYDRPAPEAAMFASLPDAPLDIIGDVHGERDALDVLTRRLGYRRNGSHPKGRRLVFVGDLCDRGPDSPRVIERVRRIVESERGFAILGNHELNLLRAERKDGNDWFWGEEAERDRKYRPWAALPEAGRAAVLGFFEQLPLVLERDDLRVVHAAWHTPSLPLLREHATRPGRAHERFRRLDVHTAQTLQEGDLSQRDAAQRAWLEPLLHDETQAPPMLDAVAASDRIRQMGNPMRVLTSGVEREAAAPFYSGGKWRFVERVKWWDDYADDAAVVVGHYWRRYLPPAATDPKRGENLFAGIAPTDWHGQRGNVFCVDYSVGGRFLERRGSAPVGHNTKLAALRWPERELVFDTGEVLPTPGFGRN
jgi:Calcineurin-like phosphoesterase